MQSEMTQHATAVLENNNLSLITPLTGIPEHSIVRITVEQVSPPSKEKQLAMLRAVPVAQELADGIEEARRKQRKVEEF